MGEFMENMAVPSSHSCGKVETVLKKSIFHIHLGAQLWILIKAKLKLAWVSECVHFRIWKYFQITLPKGLYDLHFHQCVQEYLFRFIFAET